MLRLAVRVRRQDAELVLAELLELVPGGVEERSLAAEVVEFAVYGAPGEMPALPDLKAAAGDALVEVSTEQVPDGWSERWRAFHRPLVLGDALTVRPPWEPAADTLLDVVIDPGQAFGTGSHPTTRLCLELMLELEPGGAFLDLGCGSGVLAIVAARLGWSPVLALDNDPAALRAAEENARTNGIKLRIERLDLRVQAPATAPTTVANLLAPLLSSWAARLGAKGSLPERVLASGLLHHEADGVAHAFAGAGLDELERRRSGEWTALRLVAGTGGLR